MSQHDKIAAVFREFDEPPTGTIERDEASISSCAELPQLRPPAKQQTCRPQFTLALKLLGFDVNEEPLSTLVEARLVPSLFRTAFAA